MNKRNRSIFLALVCGAFTLASTLGSLAQYTKEPGVLFLDQGWSDEDRLRYYNTSQGSALMSWDIFLNLEQADSQLPFRSDENSVRFGLVPQPPDPVFNPDGVPIGINKTVMEDGRWKGSWMGLGCAACHNGQLEYRGKKVRIAGGSNINFDLLAYLDGLDRALAATAVDPQKFDRLAAKVGDGDDAGKEALRKRLEAQAAEIQYYSSVLALPATPVGPGRIDALTLIHTQIQSNVLGIPENWRASISPAKYSFVWNIPQSAWAQWPGLRKDPILRNLGEVLAVFARFDLRSPTPEQGLFDSTVDLKGQFESEDLLRRLAPPPWPEQVFGTIDQEKAARGKELFAEICASCHSSYPHRWSEPKKMGKRFIENALVSIGIIGTDRTMLASPVLEPFPTSIAGNLSSRLEPPFTGEKLATSSAMFNAAQRGVYEKKIKQLNLSEEELISAHGYRSFYPEELEPVPALGVFKANPADGMWASPPFLHNGSVPNLYELLGPAVERSKTFYIGREFDPIKVGVDTTGKSGSFLFDTSQVGNGNSGHSFDDGSGPGTIGRRLSEDERWALVEFMKSIPNAPNQVAPFGGPENPVRAWEDKTFFHVRNPGTYSGAPQSAMGPAAAGPVLAQETIEPGEEELINAITQASLDRLRTQFPPGTKPVLRDAHPKAHGLVRAEFIVLDGLPDTLRHGVFKTPRTFDALIRFSAGNVEVQADTEPQAAGMAIKLLGVDGEKLLAGEKDAQTQDFIMINFPGFFVRNLKDYALLHEEINRGRLEEFFRTRPAEAQAIQSLRSQPLFNPLQVRYWSMTPYLLGPHAIKFSATPISRVTNRKPETLGPDFMREVMLKQLSAEDVYFEFGVQLQTDPVKMPVEDPLVIWDEAASPFHRVAIIRIPQQDISAKGWVEFAEHLAFTPWHALPEHRPLGSNNRARKVIYETISEFRRKANGVPREEPKKIP